MTLSLLESTSTCHIRNIGANILYKHIRHRMLLSIPHSRRHVRIRLSRKGSLVDWFKLAGVEDEEQVRASI
jgi:hypothetical protein